MFSRFLQEFDAQTLIYKIEASINEELSSANEIGGKREYFDDNENKILVSLSLMQINGRYFSREDFGMDNKNECFQMIRLAIGGNGKCVRSTIRCARVSCD